MSRLLCVSFDCLFLWKRGALINARTAKQAHTIGQRKCSIGWAIHNHRIVHYRAVTVPVYCTFVRLSSIRWQICVMHFYGWMKYNGKYEKTEPKCKLDEYSIFLLICFFSPFKMGKHISIPLQTFPFRCIRFSMPSQFSNFFSLRNMKIQMESYQKPKQTKPTPKCRKHPNKQFTCNFHRWLSFRLCLTVFAVFLLLRLSCNSSNHNFVIFLQFLYFRLNDGALECLWVFVLSPFQFVVQ